MMGTECVLNTVTIDGVTFLCYTPQVIRLDPFKSCFIGAVSVTIATSVQSVLRIFEAILHFNELGGYSNNFLILGRVNFPFPICCHIISHFKHILGYVIFNFDLFHYSHLL